ncbi:MAG: hypothetical protein DHS20C04_27290 [Hyphococcus sp.]|nr:MAG: hypothetical protein DHS20C04_27290 [Marinicaulis sp.]
MIFEPTPGYVYVATLKGNTKIGYTFDPEHRAKLLRAKLEWTKKITPHRIAWHAEQIALTRLVDHLIKGEEFDCGIKMAVDALEAAIPGAEALFELDKARRACGHPAPLHRGSKDAQAALSEAEEHADAILGEDWHERYIGMIKHRSAKYRQAARKAAK